jgi:soluble lytic murein transglycosylase-like protein
MQTPTKKTKSLTTGILTTLAAAVAIVFGPAGSAVAAQFSDFEPLRATHLERVLGAGKLRNDYRQAYEKAKKLEVEPKRSAAITPIAPAHLKPKLEALRKRIRRAEREPAYGTPESVGVPSATLESIASCESGGNPAAVSSTGAYRGKYQFDYGTWAGVGGSGDPAAAPEAEQDYRAALLYSRSGSSPWPVCG